MRSHSQGGNTPTITVVTPSFNQGRYIERTILSVLDQRGVDVEYLVIDGGSTDGTVEILKKYESRLRWVSEPDRGQADAINKGLKQATGEIVCWLNSDDEFLPDALSKVAGRFSDPGVDMILSPVTAIDENGNALFVTRRKSLDFRALLYGCQIVNQEGIFWRRRVHDTIGYLNPDLQYAMDFDFFLRMSLWVNAVWVDEKLACHRRHGDQKSARRQDYLAEVFMIRERYRRAMKIGRLSFWINERVERMRRRYMFYGLRNMFRKEWKGWVDDKALILQAKLLMKEKEHPGKH